MDTKHTAKTTAPSVASAKPAQKPKPEPEDPVLSVPLSGLEDDPLRSLPAAFSGLPAQTPEGKAKEKETGEGGAEDNPEGGLERRHYVFFGKKPSESAPSATEHPATSSRTATTLPATHPAASSPTATPSAVEGTGFTVMPYITP